MIELVSNNNDSSKKKKDVKFLIDKELQIVNNIYYMIWMALKYDFRMQKGRFGTLKYIEM